MHPGRGEGVRGNEAPKILFGARFTWASLAGKGGRQGQGAGGDGLGLGEGGGGGELRRCDGEARVTFPKRRQARGAATHLRLNVSEKNSARPDGTWSVMPRS